MLIAIVIIIGGGIWLAGQMNMFKTSRSAEPARQVSPWLPQPAAKPPAHQVDPASAGRRWRQPLEGCPPADPPRLPSAVRAPTP